MSKGKKVAWFIFTLVVIYVYGVMSARLRLFPAPELTLGLRKIRSAVSSDESGSGSWFAAKIPANGLTKQQQEAVTKISSLPYLKGYSEAPETDRVTIYHPSRTDGGFNLLVSGHGPEAVLVDMEGETKHKWAQDFDDVWSQSPNEEGEERYKTFWNRVHLFDNGDLLAIFRDFGLIKLDKASRLLWKSDGRYHHDMSVKDDDGTIYILARKTIEPPDLQVESWATNKLIWDDQIVVLNEDGSEKSQTSILRCFKNSDFAPLLEHLKVSGNILHTNALKILDAATAAKHPLFSEGDVLISCREIHTIAIINLAAGRVVWAATGMWKYQHEPTFLTNGNILLFDNRGYFGKSKVIEFNPMTMEIDWTYYGKPPHVFFSKSAGTCHRLPNGNTLITESNRGRVFEVSPGGKIVWEFYNPHRAGDNNELIAALYDVIRVEKSHLKWLGL